MAKKGKGLDTGVIKMSSSLTIDSRIKVGTVLWLQEKYDMDFSEVLEILKQGKIKDTINLIIGLAIQHNPDTTEVEVRKLISQLEIQELTDAAGSLTDAFKTDVKNSKRPIKGNLTE